MSVIKQISVFDGSNWNTGDIGADASNIDISSAILGSNTNVQSALTTIGNKIGTTAIPSRLGTTITGAINTLNTNFNTLDNRTLNRSFATVPSGFSGAVYYSTIGKITVVSGVLSNSSALSANAILATGLPRNDYGANGVFYIVNNNAVNSYFRGIINSAGQIHIGEAISANASLRFFTAYVNSL